MQSIAIPYFLVNTEKDREFRNDMRNSRRGLEARKRRRKIQANPHIIDIFYKTGIIYTSFG
jgi:hypothetical protein